MRVLLSITLLDLISITIQSCADHYRPLESCIGVSAAALISDEGTTYTCSYNTMIGAGDPPASETCTLTCPPFSTMVALLPDFNVHINISSAYFDSVNWLVTQVGASSGVSVGNTIHFGCLTPTRCTPYIDDKGVEHRTKCNLVDSGVECNEDTSLPLCTCTEGMTGTTCGITLDTLITLRKIGDYERLRALLEAARKHPALLGDNFPAILAFLNEDLKQEMSWSLDEGIR